MNSLKIFAITFAISAPIVFLVEVFALSYKVRKPLYRAWQADLAPE